MHEFVVGALPEAVNQSQAFDRSTAPAVSEYCIENVPLAPDPVGGARLSAVTVMITPFWVTLNVRPATVIDAARLLVPVCDATLKPTLPEPLPLLPDGNVIQLAPPLLAVHEQPAIVVTSMLLLPPAAGNVWLVGLIEKLQAAYVTALESVPLPVSGLVTTTLTTPAA